LIGAFAILITDIKAQAVKPLHIGRNMGGTNVKSMERWINQQMAQAARVSVEA